MSDNHDYLRTSSDRNFRLRADILSLMLKGAGFAAIACLALWFVIAATYWIGGFLPEESRETEDPTPFTYLLNDPSIGEA